MNISFVLDREEKIDPNEALGDIIISNNKSQIAVISTYLDSWFDALINGYKNLEKHNKMTLEIVEEPELITFETNKNGFNISYGKQVIFFDNIQEFYLCLLKSSQARFYSGI